MIYTVVCAGSGNIMVDLRLAVRRTLATGFKTRKREFLGSIGEGHTDFPIVYIGSILL